MVQIKARLLHMADQRVAGLDGRSYHVHPETMLLHRVEGSLPVPEAGVLPEDAAELRSFQKSFQAVGKPPPPPRATKAPKKADPDPPAAGGAESDPVPDPPAEESPSVASESTDDPATDKPTRPSGKLKWSDALPKKDKVWSVEKWVTEARKIGIEITKDETKLRPKSKLVALIREKAAAHDAAE